MVVVERQSRPKEEKKLIKRCGLTEFLIIVRATALATKEKIKGKRAGQVITKESRDKSAAKNRGQHRTEAQRENIRQGIARNRKPK